MTFSTFLIHFFSLVPRFNFQFQWSNDVFNLNWKSEYFQSLALLALLGVAITVLLLITIVIVWICESCRKNEATGKTRRRIRRLSTVLFIISVVCFVLLGLCLFANEHVNRGMSISINSVINTKRSYTISMLEIDGFQQSALNTTVHLKQLEDVVHTLSKKVKNETIVQQIDQVLTNITDEVDIIAKNGKLFQNKHEADVAKFENIRRVLSTYESERWAFLVIVLSITMCVLFAGVIAFCRQSKKGAVVFSAIGFFIFLVVWALISVSIPLTIALSDFCRNGDDVTHQTLGNLYDHIKFYNNCKPSMSHDNLPPSIHHHVALLNNIPSSKSQLDRLMEVAFNGSELITNSSSLVGNDISEMLKNSGAVLSSSSCFVFHDDVVNFYYGTCNQSIDGMAIYLICVFFLGVHLFILLIIVSKTWHLFSKLSSSNNPIRVRPFRYESASKNNDCGLSNGRSQSPAVLIAGHHKNSSNATLNKRVSFRAHEYVEVDEDDPFFPRGANDSNIPVDIYGTHVYNPRTRDRTEPSTNTTSGTAPDEQATPLWSQNAVVQANGTSSATSQPFMSDHPYGNYGDRYDM